MDKGYFFIYLVYGFAFINMGMFSIQEKDIEITNVPLVKSLKYLGYFGIIHGISEWIIMVSIVGLYPECDILIFNIKEILKAVSFGYLMYFGMSLLPVKKKHRNMLLKIPLIISLLWLIGFIWLIQRFGYDYHMVNSEYNVIVIRYIMALPSGVISSIALFLRTKEIKKKKSSDIAKRYKSLAWIFLIYGLLEGALVRKMDFFPANIINSTVFLEIFRFPTQIVKASVGVGINILLIKVIDTFGWEQKEKLRRLEEHRIGSEERRKLGLEIHDGILQYLYAAGLKVEYMMKNKEEDKRNLLLPEIRDDLNKTIFKIREFLSSSTLDVIEIEDLSFRLQKMVEKFNENQSIVIALNYEISSLEHGQLSSEKSTQIYYVIQEAIVNIIKHSQATRGEVNLEAKQEHLYIEVLDNGIGITYDEYDPSKQLGISSMEDRIERIGGVFNIERVRKGTKIELIIPWEVNNEEKD